MSLITLICPEKVLLNMDNIYWFKLHDYLLSDAVTFLLLCKKSAWHDKTDTFSFNETYDSAALFSLSQLVLGVGFADFGSQVL